MSEGADYSDIAELQRALLMAADKMADMTNAVGMARHILEYDSDRRKKALALAAAPLLSGNSSAAADTLARASDGYNKAMSQLGKEHTEAEKIIVEYDTTRIRWETMRSLLSAEREKTRI